MTVGLTSNRSISQVFGGWQKGPQTRAGPCVAESAGAVVKLEFHDADNDTNTDTDILASILADTSDTRDF